MNILAVDTAGKTLGVALLQDDRLKYECYLDGGMTHSETLMPLVDHCLKLCGLTCADIDLFGVNAGPGSLPACASGWPPSRGWLSPARPSAPRSPHWKRWPPPTPARAPCSAHWMPAVPRCTALRLTWPPTPACWMMMPGLWLTLPNL